MTVQEYQQYAELQQSLNRIVAETTESDEKTAYKYVLLTKQLLKKPIDSLFLCQLAALCYYMGAENFRNSKVLRMINAQMDAESIRNEHEMTLLHYKNIKAEALA